MTETVRAPWFEKYKVDLEDGSIDGAVIDHFVIPEQSIESVRLLLQGRPTSPGTYTRLTVDGRLWMTDTPAEIRDLGEVFARLRRPETRRVLINGLGLGMVVSAALAYEHVEHIDVVERDPRVIALVAPQIADPRLVVHEADALTITWPTGTRWDVAWHDIWEDICLDNEPEMQRLSRRYGRRVGWQGCWGREEAKRGRGRW